MALQEVSNVTTASQINTSSELWMWDQYLSGKIFPHFQNCFSKLERISSCYTRILLGSCGREFGRYPPLCIERTCLKGEQSKWGVQLALTLPSWEHRDQGTGAAGKPPGPNSDTKGQIIQRRRQQIPYAPVAYLIQEEGYWWNIHHYWLFYTLVSDNSSFYIPHMHIYIYSLLHMFRTYNFIYFIGVYIMYTQNT